MYNDLSKEEFSTLIITGTGFSHDAGIPLDKDIISKGVELCQRDKPELLKNIEEDCSRILGIKNIRDHTIEEILTKLTMKELYSNQGEQYYKSEILPCELGILELFCITLRIDLYEDLPKSYYQFVDQFKGNTIFVTLNNDFLLENVFQRSEIFWSYLIEVKGIENRLGQGDFYYKETESKRYPSTPNFIPYLKLHGSFNWHYCWRCNNVRITDYKYFGISGEPYSFRERFTQACTKCTKSNGQAVMKPMIIPPSLIKYYELNFIRYLWFVFNEVIRMVKNIIIIGTSLRDEDLLILNSLSFLNMKNSRIKEIVCINPDNNIGTKLENLTKITVVRFQDIQDYLSVINK